MARIILIVGGARSGKSRFAQELAVEIAGNDVLFVATAEPGDDEMVRRIEHHRRSRPANWRTLEVPIEVGLALREVGNEYSVLLVDCLTLLVSNVLLKCGDPPDFSSAQPRVEAETNLLLDACRRHKGTVIIVSGEVGLGLVPDNPLARVYRDLLGWSNQRLASAADDTYWLASGIPVNISTLGTTPKQAVQALET